MAASDLSGHDEPVVTVVAAVERGGVGARKSIIQQNSKFREFVNDVTER